MQTKGFKLATKKINKKKAMPMYIRGMLNGGKFILHSIVIIIGKKYNLSYKIKQRLIPQLG